MKYLYLLVLFILSISVSQAQRAPKAINDVATVVENGTITINVLANDSNFNTGDTVCLSSLWGGASGWATIQTCSKVTFHPLNPTFVGLDTFFYRACDNQQPTLCDTGRVIVTMTIRAPKAYNDTASLVQGTPISINVLSNDSNFNPPDTIHVSNIWGMPAGWAGINPADSTQILIHPTNPNFYGVITFFYRSFDKHIPALNDTGAIVVNIIRTPRAYTDTATVQQPDTAFINVLANDSDLNVLDSACVTGIWGLPAGWASIQGCNVIAYDPANATFSGRDTFYYQSCYTKTPTVCDTAMVTLNVILSRPLVDFYWIEDSPCVAWVFDNSLLADSLKWTIHYVTNNGTDQTLLNVSQFPLTSLMADSGFNAQVCLTAFNSSGDSSVCYTFWIQCTITNGIAAIPPSRLIVYPNPASDRIHIDLPAIDRNVMDEASTIVLYDMMGRGLKTIPISEISNGISVNELRPGIYLVWILDKDQNKNLLCKFEVLR